MPIQQIAKSDYLEIVSWRRHFVRRQPLNRASQPSSPAECCKSAMASDSEQPRSWVLHTVKSLVVPQGVTEGVLQQIFSERSVAHHLHEKPTQLLLTLDEEVLNSLRVESLFSAICTARNSAITTGGPDGDVCGFCHLRVQMPIIART